MLSFTGACERNLYLCNVIAAESQQQQTNGTETQSKRDESSGCLSHGIKQIQILVQLLMKAMTTTTTMTTASNKTNLIFVHVTH